MKPSHVEEKASVDSLVAQIADDFLNRLGRGEQPAISEYVRRYPDVADVIPQVLSFLRVIKEAPSQKNQTAERLAAPEGGPFVNGCLGDYRIVREVGRGAMGIVYEAEQISLGRRVALKVLPLAATLESKQSQRFKIEAQAAAHLHHENIVPIYAIGCESGIHYYAMQFIEGQTLAAIIRDMCSEAKGEDPAPNRSSMTELATIADHQEAVCETVQTKAPASVSLPRTSFFQTVANLGIQAAEALQHAHDRMIVHRDIKPSNLLVDRQSKLWITDFGLARFQQNPGLTMTGDLLGTLRYMSPEQALGQNDQVDHRSDVYGLGVTLYELLTLAPAYASSDRQQILRQIGAEEVRPPRRLRKAIPVDLETIVLKAMAKSPENRYATAQALADDLRCFLEDKPIRAKRPPLLERMVKWQRRHKTLVRAGAVVTFIAAAATLVSAALIHEEHKKREIDQETAQNNARMEVQAQRVEEAQKIAADLHNHRKQVRQTLNQVAVDLDGLVPVIHDLLDTNKRSEAKNHLDTVLHYAYLTLEENAKEEYARQGAAKVYRRTAQLEQMLGQHKKAEEAFRQAIVLMESLLATYQASERFREELAKTSPTTGKWNLRPATVNPAIQLAPTPYRVQQPGNEDQFRSELGDLYFELGTEWLTQGQAHKAVSALQQSVGMIKAKATPANAVFGGDKSAQRLLKLGIALEATSNFTEAEKAYRQSLDHWERLAKGPVKLPQFHASLEDTRRRLNKLLIMKSLPAL
jgi:eukaryotic-like serine/threonine-protein kinase